MPTDRGVRTEGEFEEFAIARTPQLFRSAWLLCGDRHQAEDLVQETLAKVYVRWRRPLGSRIDNPAAYAQTSPDPHVPQREAASRRSQQAPSCRIRRPARHRPLPIQPRSPVERFALRDALAELAEPDRVVLVLRYLEDLSVDEVAERMGTSSRGSAQPFVPGAGAGPRPRRHVFSPASKEAR